MKKRTQFNEIASWLRGGWWYGTERYREEDASEFVVESAEFH